MDKTKGNKRLKVQTEKIRGMEWNRQEETLPSNPLVIMWIRYNLRKINVPTLVIRCVRNLFHYQLSVPSTWAHYFRPVVQWW